MDNLQFNAQWFREPNRFSSCSVAELLRRRLAIRRQMDELELKQTLE